MARLIAASAAPGSSDCAPESSCRSAPSRAPTKRHAVIAAKAVSTFMTPPSDARPRACRPGPIRSLRAALRVAPARAASRRPRRRPAERAAFKALGHEAHTGAVPPQELHAVGALGAEHVYGARVGISAESLLHERGERVRLLSEVHRPRGHEHLQLRSRQHHDALPNAPSPAVVSGASPGPLTCPTQSPIAISITLGDGGAAGGDGGAAAHVATTTRAKPGA